MQQLNLRQIIVKFFRPLNKRYRLLTVSASLIIGLAFYLVVDIGFAEVVRQNRFPVHILATELLTEAGPCLVTESGEHANMVQLYVDHLEKRQFAGVLRLLYPTYSPERVFASVLPALEKPADQKEAKTAIWEAGVAINQLYTREKRFPRSPIKWFKSEKLPEWLLTGLNNALADSNDLVNKLNEERTKENALKACRANRKTILLLSLAQMGYDDQKKIREFLIDVKRADEYTRIVANKKENVETKEQILEWAESEARRAKILDAMLAGDMEKVCHLLTEAVERAYKKREGKIG